MNQANQPQKDILTQMEKTEHWMILRNCCLALASVAQLVRCHPARQKVAGWISGEGTCLGSGPSPVGARARGSRLVFLSHISVSLSLPSPLSKNK